MPRLLVDIRPLRESRDFRILYFGQFISLLGSNLTTVAIPYQVYVMTHQSFWVGMASLVQFPFLVSGSFLSGPLGDRHDRRRLTMIGTTAAMFTSLLLGCNASLAHPQLAIVIVVAAFASFATGFTNPQRNAMIPRILSGDRLVAGYSLFQIVFNVGLVVGPSLAGLLLAQVNVASCYYIDAATFIVGIAATAALGPHPPSGAAAPERLFVAMRSGFRYVREHPLVQAVYLVDMNAMIFGLPRALFPAVAFTMYHGGPRTLGLLYAAVGMGAVLMAFTTGWVGRVKRQGRVVALVVMLWGLAMATFGLVHVLAVGVICLAVAGATDVISTILRNAILQTSITDEFRSRITSIQFAVVQGGPRLGDFESGVMAAGTSTEFSIISGGLACIAGVIALLRWRPSLWTQEGLTD